MAFFKFRKQTDAPAQQTEPGESVETLRRRAKYRLTGAAVLVLIGVIGFPILFDQQPRPIAVDTPIDIPDRNKARALPVPSAPATSTAGATVAPTVGAAPVSTVIAPVATISAPARTAAVPPRALPASAATPTKPADKLPPPAVEKRAPVKPAVDSGARAQALLDGKEPEQQTVTGSGRYVVQIGAFTEQPLAREARLKAEHAGLKTYTQITQTKEGRRIRVRVGPFATRAQAEQAVEKIRKLNLPAKLLTL